MATLLVLAIVLPLAGVLLSLALGGRHVERIAFVLLPSGLVVALIIFANIWRSGERLIYIVGDWTPPLGIALRADGLSAAMMAMTAIVVCAVGVFAHADFDARAEAAKARAPFGVLDMLMAIWGAMNMIFLGGDLFTLYVALELLTFAAVPMVCLDGRAETLQAALRYLLFALLGSILYLVGAALLYGSYATLDIVLLSRRIHMEPATLVAATLMTVGLLRQDRALSPASLASAGPCRCAGSRQRGSFGGGGEGVVLPRRAALVRCHAGVLGPAGGAALRCAWGGGHCIRQRHRIATAATQAPDRLFDGCADRLPVPDVSARL